jgi:hypothetical protein
MRDRAGVTADDVRAYVADLPRSYEVFVRGRWKFRVGQIVWIAFSKDEKLMGFAFPKEERQMLVETEPDKFMYPRESDMRFNWVVARLDKLSRREMEEYCFDAWRMVVPKKLLSRGELPDRYREQAEPENADHRDLDTGRDAPAPPGDTGVERLARRR